MSTITDLTQLAEVDSAKLYTYEFLGSPVTVLEVVAQQSGFNWDLRIRPGFLEDVEYFPYLVVETKMSPDWPKNIIPGPVVPPATLHKTITHFGTKGIEVIGSNGVKKLDYPLGV
jgi:hypothetical protein